MIAFPSPTSGTGSMKIRWTFSWSISLSKPNNRWAATRRSRVSLRDRTTEKFSLYRIGPQQIRASMVRVRDQWLPVQTDERVCPERNDLRFDREPSTFWDSAGSSVGAISARLFFAHRALAQNFNLILASTRTMVDSRPTSGRTGIQNQGNPSLQFVEHMFCPSRTDASKTVCTRSCQRLSESPENLHKNRVTWHSNRHLLKSGRNQVRHQIGFWETESSVVPAKIVPSAFPERVSPFQKSESAWSSHSLFPI